MVDHGGGIDAARARFGGERAAWIDLSTGINPEPYPTGAIDADAWTALPDSQAQRALTDAAREVWQVPQAAAILAAPGASALIAQIPRLWTADRVRIDEPTYNEHGRAFLGSGWDVGDTGTVRVIVHPNNPDGRLWTGPDVDRITVIDESFCDVMPEASLIAHAARPRVIMLKSFGKFWGLAGLRLGFAIGDPELLDRLATMLGPWPVSGPALRIGTQALTDRAWADRTRSRLASDARRLDTLTGLPLVGGTDLFRLYDAGDAAALQERLARARIWTRIFPYSTAWIRFGLPGPEAAWDRLVRALE